MSFGEEDYLCQGPSHHIKGTHHPKDVTVRVNLDHLDAVVYGQFSPIKSYSFLPFAHCSLKGSHCMQLTYKEWGYAPPP